MSRLQILNVFRQNVAKIGESKFFFSQTFPSGIALLQMVGIIFFPTHCPQKKALLLLRWYNFWFFNVERLIRLVGTIFPLSNCLADTNYVVNFCNNFLIWNLISYWLPQFYSSNCPKFNALRPIASIAQCFPYYSILCLKNSLCLDFFFVSPVSNYPFRWIPVLFEGPNFFKTSLSYP